MTMIWYPQPGENGKPVPINHPSRATDIATAGDPDQIASFVPGSPVPAKLNGVLFKSWVDAPTTLNGWNVGADAKLTVVPTLD